MTRLTRWLTPRRLKLAFYLTLAAIVLLIGYRLYLSIYEQGYHAAHAEQIDRIQSKVDGEGLSFAVVGNINNSVGLFERKMIPMLNQAGPDFVVSAGNAVSGAGEDKYRALHRTLSHLEMPYVLTAGEKEGGAFGSFNFYEHFGPFFHGFRAGNSQFLFLDSTNPNTYPFQIHWLEQQLRDPFPKHRFVFIGHPMFQTTHTSPIDSDSQYLADTEFRDRLHELFRKQGVDAVFSSNLHLFDRQERDGVNYVVTGGAGGLVLNDDTSFYHYVDVQVTDDQVTLGVERLDIGQHQFFKTLESLWFFIHSLFYVGHLNFLLVLGLLILLAIKLYSTIFVERDYYRNYDLDTSPWRDRSLSIAMVTNNYLPFIGGVPISIDRLRRGLEQLAHRVLIVAPSYPDQDDHGTHVVRVPSCRGIDKQGEFRLANPLSPAIRHGLRSFAPDLIHIHHPFWLGWVAQWHARRLKVPTVFTYHTRLEHYAHFVPLPGPLFRNLIAHTAIRRFANRCDGVIVPTASAEEYLRVIGVTSPIYIHPTGIDFDRFRQPAPKAVARLREEHGIADDERVLVSVSRLSKEKNIDFLISAIDELRRTSEQPFRCLIIGEGDEHERLQMRIESLGLERVVTLVGAVSPEAIAHYYQLGDLFIFASKSETQGMVILEAMAAGLPVVAVRSSGIDDVVKHENNGFKTAENIPLWVEAARHLIEDDELRAAMSEQAVTTARRHAIDRFASNVSGTYVQVLALYHRQANDNPTPSSD
ncbi:glycosyltransferase [Guyparkeria sp.]|uniref:glycosyltransferase n=1 Tax=Guyparkeria sp. TaxID=2035736 RepID=UPI0035651485